VSSTALKRVLIISDDQWLRAGLRAELRERGYDAVGARDVAEALGFGRPDPDRGPVALILVDQEALGSELAVSMLARVQARLGSPSLVLIAPGNRQAAQGDWAAVLRRPLTIGEIADHVQRAMPEGRAPGPLD
jgi:DNA-binding response OmpR family regulator